MRRVHCCPCSILRGNPPLVLLAVLLSLAMTLFAPLQHVDAKRSSDPPIHDVGGTEGPDDSPSIAYHAFLEKFKTRIDHSPTVLSHKEVFDAVRWRLSAPICAYLRQSASALQRSVALKPTVLLRAGCVSPTAGRRYE